MKKQLIVAIVLLAVLMGCTRVPPLESSSKIVWLEQGWSEPQRQRFHHESQGTMTFPMPYEWFAALEQPGFKLFGTKGLFIENGFLARLGFITDQVTPYNQAGLPVGFAITHNAVNPAISDKPFNAIGLTCAACHTGQMRVNGVSIRYDGGPAVTDLGKLMNVLGLALIETYLNKVKFNRFAQRVLGATNTEENRKALRVAFKNNIRVLIHSMIDPKILKAKGLRTDLKDAFKEDSFIDYIRAIKEVISKSKDGNTREGFMRVDALNRIGNEVFFKDAGKVENFGAINAPVSYPFIWNTSWFFWVQYDASIMGPMNRNAGEALGVAAYAELNKESPTNFRSSVRMRNLHWMETLLAGTEQPYPNKKFGGLQHPKWDEDLLGPIDKVKHAKGAKLYAELCASCHLPPMDSEEFWSDKYWTPPNAEGMRFLDLPLVDQKYIATDAQQASVLKNRKVDTTGIGIDIDIYLESKNHFEYGPVYYGANTTQCEKLHISDGKEALYATSLGAAGQQVINYWYDKNGVPQSRRHEENGFRINCLRAPFGYKARPLNGIWATSPYLHNGSIPDMYTLLSPMSERPNTFYSGSIDYNVEKMGYETPKGAGYFLFDTSLRGNSNKGHVFSDEKAEGVIGRGLSVEERYQLIEYLKDIRSVAASG